MSSVCSVRSSLATAAAAGASLNSGSRNPIENVRTGPVLCRGISATTALESSPLDRNAPSGTSEISR